MWIKIYCCFKLLRATSHWTNKCEDILYYYQTETMKDHSEIFSDHLKFQLINEIGLICSSVQVGNVATGKFANLSSQLSCHQSSLASFRQAFNFEKHTQLPQCFYYVKSTFGGTAKQMYFPCANFPVHAHIWHDWRKISEIFKLQILRDDSTKFSKRPMTPLFWKNWLQFDKFIRFG